MVTQVFNPPWTFSDRFKTALRSTDREMVIKAEVIIGPNFDPVDVTNYFTDGNLTVGRDDIRRSGRVTFEDRGDGLNIIPKTPDDLLAPYGNQLRLWYGLVLPDDNSEEYVPVGTLRLTKPEARYPFVALDVSDLAWIVQGNKLETSYSIPPGTNYSEAIRALLVFVYPDVVYDIPEVSDTTPRIIIDAFEDPWAHLQNMATAVGHALFFDPMGTCLMRPEQDLIDVDPVWTYDGSPFAGLPYDPEDWANLALYDETIAWDTQEVFNAVVAVSEGQSNLAVYRGVAYDTDAASPTRYGGKFGQRVTSVSDPLITSNGQAEIVARTTLQRSIGLAEALRIPAIPNPALEPANPIAVIRPELGVNTVHQIDRYQLALRAKGGPQVINTRVRRVVLGQ